MPQPLKRPRSLAAQVYQELKRDIILCVLRPGQEVFEGQLAERYGVSKTPIREALNTLRQEAYVQVAPRRGYMITPVSIQDVQHVFHVRLLLEPSAAELAAQRVTGPQLAELRRLAMPRGSGHGDAHAANRSFHLAVAEASGNPRLAAFIGKLLEEVERLYHLGLDFGQDHPAHADSHLALVEALMEGDHHLARDIMSEAVQTSRRRVMEALIGSDSRGQSLVLIEGRTA